MLSNIHTHSTFCDGKNTPEEIVKHAIENGFVSIGFSGHSFTWYDQRYCMQDTKGYVAEIRRLKKEYEKDIEIYLGTEEDAFAPVDRGDYDYILGSCHYIRKNGRYYPIDSSIEYFGTCLDLFDHDILQFAESYYQNFCYYLNVRRPEVIGHFDLITKFDEMGTSLFFANDAYNKIAEKYVKIAAGCDGIFEVNTGAISRNFRKTPYPSMNLLHTLKKMDARLTITSDSHTISTLNFGFEEAKALLRDVGFRHIYILRHNEFTKYDI